MMVTLVSQCEKKALSKTRRVLDAFANRIGSRTWQTVITDDGLSAVKKLLRKTASKNTAVSCHWIRSRSRSDLIWIVGSKDKFSVEGIVPVNYTNQEGAVKMDNMKIDIEKYFANTKEHLLDQHLFAVGYAASWLIKQFVDDEKLAQTVFVAGCLHDIGKIDPAFQDWVKKKIVEELPDDGQHINRPSKFSFKTHPRHNEISAMFYHLLNDENYKEINKSNKERIKHVLYWHHAKPFRKEKEEFKDFDVIYKKLKKNTDVAFLGLPSVFNQLVHSVNSIAKTYFIENELMLVKGLMSETDGERVKYLYKESIPLYKHYTSNDDVCDYINPVRENAKNNLARMAVVTADRLISALSNESLNIHIEEATIDSYIKTFLLDERGLVQDIEKCIEGFNSRFPQSDRNEKQAIATKSLTKVESVAVLSGPAGCGKTKIALEWAMKTDAQKIIWVCPRVQVCQGLVSDLTAREYLYDTKIEINTGEFKTIYQSGEEKDVPDEDAFSGDIVITTIDQIINSIITHRNVGTLVTYMKAHVVFDEYHEYVNMPAFNLFFAELVECKKLKRFNVNTLLVSATPNYYFVEELLGIDAEDIIDMESFNQSQYKIDFEDFEEQNIDKDHPLYREQPDNTFVISNTATTAQKSFIFNQDKENALILHSKYMKSDKQELFDKVFNCFKRGGNLSYGVLRAGPIVQASLNITCKKMVTEFTNAENWLQRLGRLGRFGENALNQYITAVPQSIATTGKQTGSCAKFLASLCSFESAKAWRDFLLEKIGSDPVTLAEIYKIYKDFYGDGKSCKSVEQDLVKVLKKSVEIIEDKLLDPMMVYKGAKVKGSVKIKKSSLRGDNRFVQMAVCDVKNGSLVFPDIYAYKDTDMAANLTASKRDCGAVKNGGYKSDRDLIAFMFKKHHNIKENYKKLHSDSSLYNAARSPDAPIFLSYIPRDLKIVEANPHPHAIYYAIGKTQIIGAVSIDKLQ